MNVNLAAQVLSHSVAAALDLYVCTKKIESKASETAHFVNNMDKLFDNVNARSLKHEEEMCAVTEKSCHVELWKTTMPWIETWYIRSSKTNMKIYAAACKNGWLITLNVFIGILKVLLKKIKFIITNRFSQDALENTFSSIRRRGGFRDNPDAYEFRHTIHQVIISNFLKELRGKNCENDEAYNLIDFT